VKLVLGLYWRHFLGFFPMTEEEQRLKHLVVLSKRLRIPVVTLPGPSSTANTKEEYVPWSFPQRTGEVTCVARRQFLDGGRSERGLESTSR